MTVDECEIAYVQLAEVLSRVGLDWVIQQLNAHLHMGKREEREVSPVTADEERILASTRQLGFAHPREASPRRRARRASFVTTVQYTPEERLRILLRAIRVAFVDVADMEREVTETLRSIGIASTEFETAENQHQIIDAQEAQERVARARQLADLLSDLESSI
jgi:hypothetical protein